MFNKQPHYRSIELSQTWTEQEAECFYCKRSTGCQGCSVKTIYNQKTCFMFPNILQKFARLGKPPEDVINGKI